MKVCTLRGARRDLYFFNALNVETNKTHDKSFEVVVCKFNVLRLNFFIQGRKQKHLYLNKY